MIEKKDFRVHAEAALEWIDQYFKNIESYPVKSKLKPKSIYNQIPALAPDEGETMESIMADFVKIIVPGITHWQHPNFHSYFPANSSMESVLAEMITAALGAQCMVWDTSPAAAELEERMMEWLKKAMALPDHFEGVIQDTASTASLVAIITAREVATNYQSNENGVAQNLRVYCSESTHSSIEKAVKIAGMGRQNLVKISIDEAQRLDPLHLERAIQQDIAQGQIPCCVVANIGTTSTVAVDPIKSIGEICIRYGIWLHVDAAYAGTALLLPEYQWMAEGMELADSFVFNPHKWMFTNFDCSAYYVKDKTLLLRCFELLPEYLKTKTRGHVNDYRDWGIPLGRRFRALKLWFVIRSFGIKGIQFKLRKHIELNQLFAQWIRENPDFELVTEPFLNFCCFRYKPQKFSDTQILNQKNQQLLEMINESGLLYLTHTKIGEVYVLRFVIGQTYVDLVHIQRSWETIRELSNQLQED